MASIAIPLRSQKSNAILKKFQDAPQNFSSIQYLENLAEQDRLIFRQGGGNSQGTIVTFTPVNGESFYFLGASMSNQDPTGEQLFTIINGNIGGNIVRQNIIVGADDTKYSTMPMDRLVGDGVVSYVIDIENSVASDASFWGYTLNTKRIP